MKKYATNTAVATLAGLTLAMLLSGCAAPNQGGTSTVSTSAAALQTTAPTISVPPVSVGTWYDLGEAKASWLGGAGPVPVSGPNASTRAVGLQREDGHWLAVVIVQSAAVGNAVVCPQPGSANLDAGSASDCVQLHRDADLDQWLKSQHAKLWQWMDQRDLTSRPRSWIGARSSDGSRLVEAHALIDPGMIEAVTRNNADFLAAGESGQKWAKAFAAATRAAVGGSVLAVPPFPYMARVGEPPKPVVTAPPAAPTRAIQVAPTAPKPAVLAPRRDRE